MPIINLLYYTTHPGAGEPVNLAEQLNLPSLFGYFFGNEKSNINTGQVLAKIKSDKYKIAYYWKAKHICSL